MSPTASRTTGRTVTVPMVLTRSPAARPSRYRPGVPVLNASSKPPSGPETVRSTTRPFTRSATVSFDPANPRSGTRTPGARQAGTTGRGGGGGASAARAPGGHAGAEGERRGGRVAHRDRLPGDGGEAGTRASSGETRKSEGSR